MPGCIYMSPSVFTFRIYLMVILDDAEDPRCAGGRWWPSVRRIDFVPCNLRLEIFVALPYYFFLFGLQFGSLFFCCLSFYWLNSPVRRQRERESVSESRHSRSWRKVTDQILLLQRLILHFIRMNTVNRYKCEVSTEAPHFNTDYREDDLAVYGNLNFFIN